MDPTSLWLFFLFLFLSYTKTSIWLLTLVKKQFLKAKGKRSSLFYIVASYCYLALHIWLFSPVEHRIFHEREEKEPLCLATRLLP